MDVIMVVALGGAMYFWSQGGAAGQGAGWACIIVGAGVVWLASVLTSKGKG